MLRVYHLVLRQKISVKYNDLHKVKKRLIITPDKVAPTARESDQKIISLIYLEIIA